MGRGRRYGNRYVERVGKMQKQEQTVGEGRGEKRT